MERFNRRPERERHLLPPEPLRVIPQYGNRNPVVVLRDVLAKCPGRSSKRLRRDILEAIASHQQSGIKYIDLAVLRRETAALQPDFDRQVRTLWDDGLIKLASGGAKLTDTGWRALEVNNDETFYGSPASPAEKTELEPKHPATVSPNRRVAVVHGRNKAARDAMFTFLRALDLDPVEWEEAISFTDSGAPYVGQALDRLFEETQATVVLFTGDDLARLGTRFQTADDPADETEPTPQARPNVLFEAGLALGRKPEQTVLVTLGKPKSFSDVAGRHMIRIDNKVENRQWLADRLQKVGCPVNTRHRTDWHRAGDFDSANLKPDSAQASEASPTSSNPPTSLQTDQKVAPSEHHSGEESAVLRRLGERQFSISRPDEALSFEITYHTVQNTTGLLVCMRNVGSRKPISRCKLSVQHVQDYNFHKRWYKRWFHQHDPINRVLLKGQRIESGGTGAATWLLRIVDDHLEVGDTGGEVKLMWPEPTAVEIWEIKVAIEADDDQRWAVPVYIRWLKDRTDDQTLGISLDESELLVSGP